ncbi:arsenical pump-driving ATPase [Deinococcus sp. SL84]|uniref:arsenical pump-driving ATPase n=1 Tax=Deinococcus sp. SL84 TaxID=2994663 RepID=UPI002274621F|nr:arsenical pump-driving ATPase [Deinococcus sp. SL84]MCY1703777.1 arsenical pump-driving ATPase [Deinococcus sp. SL84]
MQFLQNLPPYVFFTGKGGVGKTSLSCATALKLTTQGKKVLLVSTDPASNVGQVFGQRVGNQITEIASVPGLSALEIEPQAAAEAYRDRIVGPVRGLLSDDIVRGIEEQLSGACTTEIAAFDEFTGLLTDRSLLDRFDHIIFDTAPTGHTIRLLQLPGSWSSFIDHNPQGASCLGPMAGLQKQKEQYSDAVAALSDPQRTRLVLVSRAQKSALEEVGRTSTELADVGLGQQFLVVNGVMPPDTDALSTAIRQREQTALANLPTELQQQPTDYVALRPFNLVGLDALRHLLDDEHVSAAETVTPPTETDLPHLSRLIDELAQQNHGLIMTMGKGGVGKTTVAATIAVALAERGFPVHLTTSDPAAHLSETLAGEVPNLKVSRIDPHEETEHYRRHVLETKGKDLDDAGRALLEEDLRSPCTEEIAVFQAFSKLIRESGRTFVVMDTAPTGHTLLLLDATGAYHREVMRHATDTAKYTTPMMQLQNQERTKVIVVTLAETTPVLEAASLQEDLQRAGITPWAWVVNNSLLVAETTSPLLLQRAAHEAEQLANIQRYSPRLALIPLQAEEPRGREKLRQLTLG